MHPLIRVVCFLVFAAWLAWGGPHVLLSGAALLLPFYLLIPVVSAAKAWAMIRRLRWFLLSLLVVYGWFTPGRLPEGVDESTMLATLLPTVEGLTAGLLRCAVLAVIVLAVNLLLATSTREQLMEAIYGLARPFSLLGLSRERLALRMVLVMEAMDEVREIVTERKGERRVAARGLARIGDFAADVLRTVIDRSERHPPREVTLALSAPPALLQWGYPALLFAAFLLAGKLM